MKEITYRVANIDDLPTLYDFEQEIIKAERPFDSTLKSEKINYYDLKVMIESPQSEVFVATIANEIIGSGYVHIQKAKPYLNHSEYAYLGFMYVKPEHRGKGVNQRIVEESKVWAEQRNINEIRLDVYDDNHIAVHAYEKAGFKKHLVEMRMKI